MKKSSKVMLGCGVATAAGGLFCLSGLCLIGATAPPVPATPATRPPAVTAESARPVADQGPTVAAPVADDGPGWLESWQTAEHALLDHGDASQAGTLLERQPPASCDPGCREAAGEIRSRLEPWVSYASRVDALEAEVSDVLHVEAPIARYLAAQSLAGQFPQLPGGCPSRVCTRRRAGVLAQQRQRLRLAESQGRRALERYAVTYRRRKAAQMDAALEGSSIDGTFRTEGANATTLVLQYPLCGRPVAEAAFPLATRRVLEGEGFTWVGCRSYFRRYGWDLNPPPLEQQTILDAAALSTR